MKLSSILFFFMIVACSTSPSKYKLSEGKDGYSDKTINETLRFSSFLGNSSTSKHQAELLAKFRAIEVCRELNVTYAHILLIRDKTFEKEIAQTSAVTPSYYYGAAPYYGRYSPYSGVGMSVGYSSVTTNSETYTYPLFEVYFECEEKPVDARFSLVVLSSSQMKEFVKDLRGAVQVDEVLPDSPNKNILQTGDIIIKADGERIENILEYYNAFKTSRNNQVKVELFRDGVKRMVTIKYTDVTEMVSHSQDEIIKEACKIEEIKNTREICKK